MKTCKVCGEQKRRSEMGYNDTCLNCIEKGWDEYYQKKSKEELISMYKSELKESRNNNKMTTFGVLGVIVSYLFFEYISNSKAFRNSDFFEVAGEVFNQILTAVGYCLVAGIAAVICYIIYTYAISKLPTKISKTIVAVLLCVAAFFIYVYFLTT